MDQPIISFIVPIYRVEPYLKQCVDSILSQDISDMEVLLVDDGSPDRCGEIADRYAQLDSRVKVIHKKNAGLGMARNSGIAAASGKYLCFVDSDDWLEPSGVNELVECAEFHKADLVISGFYDWDNRKNCEVYVETPMNEGFYTHREIIEGCWLPVIGPAEVDGPSSGKRHWCPAWRGIYSRRFIREHDLWFPSERELLIEDLPFNFVAYYRAGRICMVNKAYYHYRYNEKSLLNIYKEDTLERYLRMRSFLLSFARETGVEESCRLRMRARDYVLIGHSISGILSPELEVRLQRRFRLVNDLVSEDDLCSVFRGLTIRNLRVPRLAKLFFLLVKYRLPSLLVAVFLLKNFGSLNPPVLSQAGNAEPAPAADTATATALAGSQKGSAGLS